ncbi:type II secretion system protein N [sulfur-oxidizing endosymbiont of Gigantopelta aegis]|uniref:type II secretion system protein N n=1 Tax=sulfur-oxidizing endosymbiont of Gigantopelta aegis TaxID=2794934 RepID=UPI0018DC014B|nr:type II secretion system protein N [sulfur-oxidizing endosymbiont of Gigantopelta aegis]
MQNILFKNIIVLAVIGLLIALTTVNALRFYRLQNQAPAETRLSAKTPVAQQSARVASSQAMVNWHLFGKNQAKQSVSMPKSTLRLKLIGIISSSKDSQARVIIAGLSKKIKYYKVGDKIKSNVTLKSIQPDHIVILHNSREETVPLKQFNGPKNMIKKVVIQ